MTIEARRSFFGLFSHGTVLVPGTSKWFDEESNITVSVNVINVVVVNPDTIRLTRYYDVTRRNPKNYHRYDTKILTNEKVNQGQIQRPIFPGVKEEIIWKP